MFPASSEMKWQGHAAQVSNKIQREFIGYKTRMITDEGPLWVVALLGSRFLSNEGL